MEKIAKITCSEDWVEYKLYVDLKNHQNTDEIIQKIFLHLNPITTSHIWQNEPFTLRPYPETNGVEAHLHGRTRFGDNVEDEWFIVYLLLELTKHLPDIIVQVHDNDGEFLLIEAADDLPRWLEPETAENRVFISGGNVHIIPLPEDPVQLTQLPSGELTRQAALQCVRAHPNLTRASPAVQQAISRRVQGFDYVCGKTYTLESVEGPNFEDYPDFSSPIWSSCCHEKS